jgi:hypothetical protein
MDPIGKILGDKYSKDKRIDYLNIPQDKLTPRLNMEQKMYNATMEFDEGVNDIVANADSYEGGILQLQLFHENHRKKYNLHKSDFSIGNGVTMLKHKFRVLNYKKIVGSGHGGKHKIARSKWWYAGGR